MSTEKVSFGNIFTKISKTAQKVQNAAIATKPEKTQPATIIATGTAVGTAYAAYNGINKDSQIEALQEKAQNALRLSDVENYQLAQNCNYFIPEDSRINVNNDFSFEPSEFFKGLKEGSRINLDKRSYTSTFGDFYLTNDYLKMTKINDGYLLCDTRSSDESLNKRVSVSTSLQNRASNGRSFYLQPGKSYSTDGSTMFSIANTAPATLNDILGKSPDGIYTFGRSSDCSVIYKDTNVSRHHLEVEKQGNNYILKDLGSKNGTQIFKGSGF